MVLTVARFLGWLIVIALSLLVVKWLLITAAVLAVPFGAWWVWDRSAARRTAARAT